MLDVHPAHHAADSWRDFFVHIATIVIGLCIAVGIEQAVEYVHRRHQISETREALRQEREENRKHFAEGIGFWRAGVAATQNNLLVLRYLRLHPDTPQEKLPGVLSWAQNNSPFSYAVWDGAQQNGVLSLMPRDEVASDAALYKDFHTIGEASGKVWQAINDAEQFNLTDYDPSHLSSSQLAQVIVLTEGVQTKQYLHGIELVGLARNFQDFPQSIAIEEIHQLRHTPDAHTREQLATARELTAVRMNAEIGASETTSQHATAMGKK